MGWRDAATSSCGMTVSKVRKIEEPMDRVIKKISAFLAILILISHASWAEDMSATSQREIAKVTLVSENKGLIAGQPFSIGVLLEPKEGWHTYWENPGDAGMATSFAWALPEGFSAGGIEWPAPERQTEGPLVSFAYPGKVFLPVTITPPLRSIMAQAIPSKSKRNG